MRKPFPYERTREWKRYTDPVRIETCNHGPSPSAKFAILYLSMKKTIVAVLVLVAFGVLVFFIIKSNSATINNPVADVSRFVPADIAGVKFDRIEKLSSPEDQGLLQKGLIYFNVVGWEATSTITIDNQLLMQTTPIILNIFVCNKESPSVCQDYLSNGVLEHNQGMSKSPISINGSNISFFEYQEKDKLFDINLEKTKMNSTSYIWCEGRYCMQMLSYSEFSDINDKLINAVINTYRK